MRDLKFKVLGAQITLDDSVVHWLGRGPPHLTHYLSGEPAAFWLQVDSGSISDLLGNYY